MSVTMLLQNLCQILAAKVCNLYKRAVQRAILFFEKERELRQKYLKLYKLAEKKAFMSIINEAKAK